MNKSKSQLKDTDHEVKFSQINVRNFRVVKMKPSRKIKRFPKFILKMLGQEIKIKNHYLLEVSFHGKKMLPNDIIKDFKGRDFRVIEVKKGIHNRMIIETVEPLYEQPVLVGRLEVARIITKKYIKNK